MAELTTGGPAGRIMATIRKEENAGPRGGVPALAARSPAAIGADVEAAPVINRSDHRGRRRPVRTRGQVGRGCGSSHAQCNETNRTHQKLFHLISLQLFSPSFDPSTAFKIPPRP